MRRRTAALSTITALATGLTLTAPAQAAEPAATDVDGPAISMSFPQADGYVSVHRPFSIHATDPDDIDRIELSLNGQPAGTVPLTGWDRNQVVLDPATPNGPLAVTVQAYDRLGNVSELTRTVVVDNDQPVFTGTPGGYFLRGTVTVSVTGLRDATGPAYLSAYFGNHLAVAGTPESPWTVQLNTTEVQDGGKILTWEVTDKAGNLTQLQRQVCVDNTAPAKVTWLKAPKNKAKLRGKVTIKADAADPFGISRVQLLVNGKVAATDAQRRYSFTLNPKKYGKKFTVQLRAYDQAGNVKYSTKRTYRR
ncbi:hypothetical protein BJY16_001399 [Actinoplanes octamycinicus]|uniref:Ig-like domain-containing protein n=1 Tax=Actinoplanes octamycinicus TaxID=135948 RepID=A0A7W7M5Q7_9ACTN|nr:Ig-like domain-containing protein [Actinoplanes octamycinicus]MBB4737940.1 hypothetical protein [Actinoplanes octamycinicus]GIE59006.1 hypothetical protein Aoc01nite_44080 [Actinoplanes octamycinicus]